MACVPISASKICQHKAAHVLATVRIQGAIILFFKRQPNGRAYTQSTGSPWCFVFPVKIF
jgi:hypothetical protein